jgi:flagellar biogenesis protein FliO
MGPDPAIRARAARRGPMAHRAPGAAWSARVRHRWPTAPVAALLEEVAELSALARRLLPSRRAAALVGLALLALVAVGGIAGAAEPPAAQRSALQAFSTAAPASLVSAPGDARPAPTPAPAAVPAALADDPTFRGPDLLDLGAKTLLVVVLLFLTLRVLRRVQGVGQARGSGTLSVLESRPLGPKTQLHLVAVGDRRLVIGQSPSGLVALGELDAAELPLPSPVPEPWARADALEDDPELEAQLAHELATGRRARLGVSA